MMSDFNGLLLVDKDKGCTSHDVVNRVRKILKIRAVGHSGTLDPIATGLMVVLVGNGTKLSQYILEGEKGYIVTARLGCISDTGDSTGQIKKLVNSVSVQKEEIEKAVIELTGSFNWEVPRYSAVKLKGKKLYDYARAGQDVVPPVKSMSFFDINFIDFIFPDSVVISMKCTKGSYVRTWVEKLGLQLGCGAFVDELRRFWSSPYKIENATSLSVLEKHFEEKKGIEEFSSWIPFSEVLPQWMSLMVSGKDKQLIENGVISRVLKEKLLSSYRPGFNANGVKIKDIETGRLLALVGVELNKSFQILRVFHS